MGWVALPCSGATYYVPDGAQVPAGAKKIDPPGEPAGSTLELPVMEAPPTSARKERWVDHAVALGADRDWSQGQNKDDLIRAVRLGQLGQQPVDLGEGSDPVGPEVQLPDHVPDAEQIPAGPLDGATTQDDLNGDGGVIGHDEGS